MLCGNYIFNVSTLVMKFLFFYICRMKKKWYFRTLIAVLAMLIVIQQNAVVPNQEIVLEFDDAEVTSLEAQNAIEIVKKQLQSIGAVNTRISKELKNGKLKISYYSDEDVECIKKILSEESSIEDNHIANSNEGNDKLPLDKNTTNYNFDVYEIQKSTDFDTDFNGKLVLEIKQKQDKQNYKNDSYDFTSIIEITNDFEKRSKVKQKVHSAIVLAIDNTSYKIPEVRAGPTV